MAKNKIHCTIDSLPYVDSYFSDGGDLETVIGIINATENPIKIYNDAGFNDILLISRKGNEFKLLMNTMPEIEKKALERRQKAFMDRFNEDGTWLFDLKNNKLLYDYKTRVHEGNWGYFAKGDFGHYLGLSGDNITPLKVYNGQNKSSIYWAVYYVNQHFSNPSGALAEEFGCGILLQFAQKLFDLEEFVIAHFEKEKIQDGLLIWEKNYEDIPGKLLKAFHREHSKIYRQQEAESEESGKKEEEGGLRGLTLSIDGQIFLSDLTHCAIPQEFFPVDIDLVLDPRVLGAFVDKGTLTFATTVVLEERARDEIYRIMKKNEKNVQIQSNAQLDNILSLGDQVEWFKQIYKGRQSF